VQVLYREEYEVLKLTYPDLPQHLQITGRQKHYERLSPFLTRPSFFIGLEADLAHAILNTVEYRTYEPGEDIVRCGQPLFALLFLILGEARASIDLSTVRTAKLDVVNGRRRSSLFALKHDGAPNASSSQDASDAPSNLRRSVRASTGGHSSPSSPAAVGSALETPPQIDGPRPSSLPGPLAPVIVSGSRIPAAARPASPPPSPASHMHEAAEPGPNHDVSAQKDVQILRQSDVIGEECLLQPGSLAQMRVRALSMVETCALPCFAYAGIVEQFPHLQRHLRKRCEASLAGFSAHSLCAFLAVGSPLFEHADLELVEAVANALTVIPCTPGQQLITRGTSSRGLFIVHSGACDCLIPDPEDPGVRKRVATRIPGQHFGELSLLDPHSPTAADVIAAEGSTTTSACMNGQSPAAIVLLLTPEAFAGICERFEKFKGLLLASMPSYREYNFFYHLPVFHDAKHDFLLALVKAIVRRTFDAGTIIQRLGNQGPKGGKDSAAEDEDHSADGGAFFVDKGQLLATSPHAKAITLTEKDFFGLETLSGIAAGGADDDEKEDEHVPIALPAGSPPLQQVQAGTDVELFVLTIEAAAALAAQFPYMTEIGDAQQKALQTQPRQGFSGASGGQKPQSTTEEHDPFAISGSGASSPPRGGGGMVGAINASDGTLDADLLSQRLSLMQASIVATGRDMRERIGTMDRGIFEYLQRRDAQHAQAINQMSSRIEALTQAIEHPQRAARSTRVAFAPRSGSVASNSSGSRSTGSEPMIERSLTGSLTSMGSSAGC
jgi:CRP-like cAMP-binding protein